MVPTLPPLRLLHLADVHLDTPFYGKEESIRRKLRDATRRAFQAAVDVAIDREVTDYRKLVESVN